MAITVKLPVFTVYNFGLPDKELKTLATKELLGGKGANLAAMSKMGIPVPAGFTIPTTSSINYLAYHDNGTGADNYIKNILVSAKLELKKLEQHYGYIPLLSVRSGAQVSMPGMMDTILNVGLHSDTINEWSTRIGGRAAWDSFRRLIQMYGSVAKDIPLEKFEKKLQEVKTSYNVLEDSDLSEEALRLLVGKYLQLYLKSTGSPFPKTLDEQLYGAIVAVFKSWNNPRASEYRKIHNIPYEGGTAVTIQSMVFGNMGETSATGVVFSRNPSNGDKILTGEYLVNAQGEDVVAGIRTPESLGTLPNWSTAIASELSQIIKKLETEFKDMQDVEFTVQQGKLYILQTRSGKRSARAAFKIARDLVNDGLITRDQAVSKVNRTQLINLLSRTIDPTCKTAPDTIGIAAGGSVVTGIAVFTSEEAINCKEPCILIRAETSPDDIGGIHAAVGILTATGGLTCHAAVVARGMNKTCVVGATALNIIGDEGLLYNDGNSHVTPYSKVTIDGTTGNVWFDIDVPTLEGGITDEAVEILNWATYDRTVTLDLDPTMEDLGLRLKGFKEVTITTALIPDNTTEAEYKTIGTKLFTMLEEAGVQEVIIDFGGIHTKCVEYETFNDIFNTGWRSDNHESNEAGFTRKINLLPADKNTTLLKVYIEVPRDHHHLGSHLIFKKGYTCIKSVKTVKDLLSSTGMVEANVATIGNVFGDTATLKQVVELMGNKVKLRPKADYWFNLLSKEA